jgi:hypothetical protein
VTKQVFARWRRVAVLRTHQRFLRVRCLHTVRSGQASHDSLSWTNLTQEGKQMPIPDQQGFKPRRRVSVQSPKTRWSSVVALAVCLLAFGPPAASSSVITASVVLPYAYASGNPVSNIPAIPNYPHCGADVSDMHLVASYKLKRVGGGYSRGWLFCGTAKWGFRHIQASDKGKRISNYPGGWPGFNYSITAVERAWTSEKYNSENKTRAFYRLFYLCDSAANWYRPILFRVVQVEKTARIITAVPDYGRKKTGPCPAPTTAQLTFPR